jgi:hypothetical protein
VDFICPRPRLLRAVYHVEDPHPNLPLVPLRFGTTY